MRDPQTVPIAHFPFIFFPFFFWVRSPLLFALFFFPFFSWVQSPLFFLFFFLSSPGLGLPYSSFFFFPSPRFGLPGVLPFFFSFLLSLGSSDLNFFFSFLLSLVRWFGFVKSWSSSSGYGSDHFDSAAAMTGSFLRCPSSDNSNWSFPMFCSLKTLKPTTANSNSNININGLGRFEFAFLFFIFFYDWEIWVCSGIYLCMFNFVLDKKSEMRKVKREKNEKWKKNELKNRARRKKSGEKKIWPSDRNGAHK